jgi:hypothetical protein
MYSLVGVHGLGEAGKHFENTFQLFNLRFEALNLGAQRLDRHEQLHATHMKGLASTARVTDS